MVRVPGRGHRPAAISSPPGDDAEADEHRPPPAPPQARTRCSEILVAPAVRHSPEGRGEHPRWAAGSGLWWDRSTAKWAVKQVESEAGVRNLRAVWDVTHWLVGSPARRWGRREVSLEAPRWVVLPDGTSSSVPADESSELFAAQLRATHPSAGVQVSIRPSFWALAGLLLVSLIVLHWVVFDPTVAAAVEFLPPSWWSVAWGVGCTALIMAGIVAHEVAHALTGSLLGGRWTALLFTYGGAAVQVLPVDPTGWSRILRSLAGPLVQLLISVPMLLTVQAEVVPLTMPMPAQQYAFWWVSGTFGIFAALTNLIPIKGTDGGKIVAGIRDLVRSRRRPTASSSAAR